VKIFEALGTRQLLYKITVTAKTKAEAIKKIRDGHVDTAIEQRYKKPGFELSGGGNAGITEIPNLRIWG